MKTYPYFFIIGLAVTSSAQAIDFMGPSYSFAGTATTSSGNTDSYQVDQNLGPPSDYVTDTRTATASGIGYLGNTTSSLSTSTMSSYLSIPVYGEFFLRGTGDIQLHAESHGVDEGNGIYYADSAGAQATITNAVAISLTDELYYYSLRVTVTGTSAYVSTGFQDGEVI